MMLLRLFLILLRLLFHLLCLSGVGVVRASIHNLDDDVMLLAPTEEYVKYMDGYIRAPGYIDLSNLRFTAISESYSIFDNDIIDDEEIYDESDKFTNDDMNEITNDNNNYNRDDVRRQLLLGDDTFAIDIAIFELPKSCIQKHNLCDWSQLGVGRRTKIPDQYNNKKYDMQWCFNGRLLLDPEKFQGQHRVLHVPKTGEFTSEQLQSSAKITVSDSSLYAVAYANCDLNGGREIAITGTSVWKSKHGYLPGELYGFMIFYTVLFVVYALLLTIFGCFMKQHGALSVQRWICVAIVWGFLTLIIRTQDYYYWNLTGQRSANIMWTAILANVLKEGVSRCLVVMVSMGWGVSRNTLGQAMRQIILLGAAYMIMTVVRSMMVKLGVQRFTKVSRGTELVYDTVTILAFGLKIVNMIFITWILVSLNHTIQYLGKMSQMKKLERMTLFRNVMLVYVLFAGVIGLFLIADDATESGILEQQHLWAFDAAHELNYILLLIGIAILWRPQKDAIDYVYQMDLPRNDVQKEMIAEETQKLRF